MALSGNMATLSYDSLPQGWECDWFCIHRFTVLVARKIETVLSVHIDYVEKSKLPAVVAGWHKCRQQPEDKKISQEKRRH